MQTLKINLHGESWTLKKFECSEEDLIECLKVAAIMKLSLKDALLNPFFYYNLRLLKVPSLENLPGKKISGMLNTTKSQIEILVDGKRIRKHPYADLLLLFPMYAVDRIQMSDDYSPGIYAEQKAIGFIASYEIKVEVVNLDDLQFKLLEFKNKILLQKPTYQNKNMVFKRKETLLIYQNSFEVI